MAIIGRPCADANTHDSCPLYLLPVNADWPSAAEDYIDGQINLRELIVFPEIVPRVYDWVGIPDGNLLVVDRSPEASHN
ncbi:hypothetical protein [Desulfovibrio sp. ZJ200]|uniref:hypothetical protein n=1 Tax=Desulfovibrio sp. ZJ200 TaxID=2709792 RepID=UPI0019824F5F|nr:hypothetical protein [Desulfovibrio sp. ZJ200]